MRIIAKNHDYYDGVQAYGQDQNLLYVRTPKTEVLKPGFPRLYIGWHWSRAWTSRGNERAEQLIVGVCGKIYPSIRMFQLQIEKESYCTCLAEVDCYVLENWDAPRREAYLGKDRGRRFYQPLFTRVEVQKWFEEARVQQDTHQELFIENECPQFVARYVRGALYKTQEWKITWNGSLKGVQFYRVMDPQTVHQEISMYLGGVIGGSDRKGKPSYKGQKMDATVSDQDILPLDQRSSVLVTLTGIEPA